MEEVARRGLTLPPAEDASSTLSTEYRFDASRYITNKLHWSPWSGTKEAPGQVEVIQAYELALRQQCERDAYELGQLRLDELTVWEPGQIIKNRIRVEAGHTVGKTKLSSGLVNHFFDCFPPAIIYTFAPSWIQIHDLLWKEIKADRTGKGLPGRINDLELNVGPDHFAKGRATSDAGGKGTERVHGQHGRHLMFVLDEAEGVPDFIWGAVDSMMSGGICMMLMLANPRTRSSKFHKSAALSTCKNFRISCVNHPNVIQGKEVVPGAVRRDYVALMIEKHCEVVIEHDPDNHTFELPFPVTVGDKEHPVGTIFKPNTEFLFRVLGIAPANIADNTLIPVGRFEAACKRDYSVIADHKKIRAGVDVARYGKDYGTLYLRQAGRIWRGAQFWKQDTLHYVGTGKKLLLALGGEEEDRSGWSCHVRVDGGGGFGGGLIDLLKDDRELQAKFPDFEVHEVHFNGTAEDPEAYDNLITQLHAEAGETLKGICVLDAPEELEADLCERTYKWANDKGIAVKRIEPKDDFKKRVLRSPDDGDGFVLCAAPDHVVTRFIVAQVW